MKIIPLMAIVAVLGAALDSAQAQKVETVFGVAKVTLPKNARIDFGEGWRPGTKMYYIYFPDGPEEEVVMIEKKTLSKSERRWTDTEWRQRRINYYKNLWKTTPGAEFKSRTLSGSGKRVTVDYEMKSRDWPRSRDYTVYLRADKTSQVLAWISMTKLSRWNNEQPRRLRSVISSLRPAK